MEINLWLRPVLNSDLPIFYTQQIDPDANQMAAFTSRDPSDQHAFMALAELLSSANTVRPIYARTAKDNQASKRVLEKCGFCVIQETKSFANARGKVIEEFMLELSE